MSYPYSYTQIASCGGHPDVKFKLGTNQSSLCDHNGTLYIQVMPYTKSHGSTFVACNNASYKLEDGQGYECAFDMLFVEVVGKMAYKSAGPKLNVKALLVFLMLGMSVLL
ncbi:putative trafficking protein particle complex subunit [Clavispora lusitaniae]|uniref:Trafficking protein particle complex subunit n=1 Tax=Clavispora lusitaniae TaxID=36911 RepID=A0ACD0WJL1_CLALS|nr:putative trafficking protein particle complex subunit [Clavispora lusitaniae]QFZ33161.1 putative trafficking protein particle complex subunit [Clavispora lusitaniae]QFZ38832.1 putative trafficking protein particle complex subunit [Clavispora lusitaniae]QFZ44514.1 putative trafficking protein particle complex subunit [Clavispora lusitaniae]QFZ50191.1 putative trafficking protein particle complex subunit [Clavispora lusitaniae]